MQGQGTVSLGGRTIRVRESARDLGMDPSTLSKILNSTRAVDSIRVGTAAKLAAYFQFPSVDAFARAVKARRDGREGVADAPSRPSDAPEGGPAASSQRGSPHSC